MKNRQTNIEVLRVLAMLLIIIDHYIVFGLNGCLSQEGNDVSIMLKWVNYFTLEPLFILSCVGTNVFVMISGYFLSLNESIRWRGILKTWIQTLFYIIVLWSIMPFILNVSFQENIKNITILPVYSSAYWFVTSYIGLLFVAPFLAMISNKLNKRQYLLLLSVGFIMCSQFLYGDIYAGGHHIGWFIYLFFVAGYIRKFSIPQYLIKHRWNVFLGILFFLFLIVTLVNAYSFYKTGHRFKLRGSNNHGMVFFLSVAIFVGFVYLKKEGRVLNIIAKISPYSFGVYLIHMNPFCYREMWSTIVPQTYHIPIVIHALITSVVIYIVCSMIDMIRLHLFEFLRINYYISKVSSKLPQL